MRQSEDMFDLDKNFKSMNQKISMSEEEQSDVLVEINKKIDKKAPVQKDKSTPWKYYIAMTTTVFVLVLLALPLFSNSNQELAERNEIQDFTHSNSNESSPAANESTKDNIMVDIENNADFDIYSLVLDVYIDDHLKATQGGANADGSKLKEGDSLSFEFLEEDFDFEGEAIIEVIMVDANSERVPINSRISIEITKGKKYFFEIVGDSKENADVKSIE